MLQGLQNGAVDGAQLIGVDEESLTLGLADDTLVLEGLDQVLEAAEGPVDVTNAEPEFAIVDVASLFGVDAVLTPGEASALFQDAQSGDDPSRVELLAVDGESATFAVRNNGAVDTVVVDGADRAIEAFAGGMNLFDDEAQLSLVDYEALNPRQQGAFDLLLNDLVLGDGNDNAEIIDIEDDSVAIGVTLNATTDVFVVENASDSIDLLV